MKYKAILFDMDGTLLDFLAAEKAAIRYWNGNTCVQRAAVVLTV